MLAPTHIGTCGWSYGVWRGLFYPKNLPPNKWLALYAQRFNAVEVNASFYHLPRETTIRRWVEETPPEFRFAVKAWRAITHYRRLTDCADLITAFFRRIEAFGEKLGPVLFQLPPRFPAEPKRLEAFLIALPRSHAYAFEFRDVSWHNPTIYELLGRINAAFCLFDLAGLFSPRVTTANFIYVRLHGHVQRYRGSYSDELLIDWANWLTARCIEGLALWVFFDNTDEVASAVVDAHRLCALLGNLKANPDAK
ncbi:MAG: DUF72 domain-containing protein [Methylohalobius sp.]|nr:DUF72 domain-containing protein [Methylohalobius sp.]